MFIIRVHIIKYFFGLIINTYLCHTYINAFTHLSYNISCSLKYIFFKLFNEIYNFDKILRNNKSIQI